MWWLAMICGHGHRGVTGGAASPRLAAGAEAGGRGLGWGRGPRSVPGSHLARGGDHEVQAINGDVDGDAHACEAEVALAQDGEEGFVGSLTGERRVGAMQPPRTRLPGVEEAEGVPERPQALRCDQSQQPWPWGSKEGWAWGETHLLLPDALHARHCLVQSVDGFPASPEPHSIIAADPSPFPAASPPHSSGGQKSQAPAASPSLPWCHGAGGSSSQLGPPPFSSFLPSICGRALCRIAAPGPA